MSNAMNILIACEFSGIVRDAFIAKGHNAVSCDLLDSERPGPHIKGDLFSCTNSADYDMMIAFPPCTHLCSSGARWFKTKASEQQVALNFIRALMNRDIPKIAIENPIGIISSHIRKPDQIIQPWWFGHGETKATCLWLQNLPQLIPSKIVNERIPRVHHESPGPDRWKRRSRTYQGIADAMAAQWSMA